MIRSRALAVIIVACATGGALAHEGCTPKRDPPEIPGPKPVLIGVSMGLTGSLNTFSPPLQNGVKVAEAQINSLGGLFGRPVEMRVIDDQSDEDSNETTHGDYARKVLQSLLDQQAIAIIGPLSSGGVLSVQKLAAAKQIIQIS